MYFWFRTNLVRQALTSLIRGIHAWVAGETAESIDRLKELRCSALSHISLSPCVLLFRQFNIQVRDRAPF